MHYSCKKLCREGLWDNNIVTVQSLALCPLLAVTGTATNGLGMGLASTAVLVASNALISALREIIPAAVRIPVYVLLIAGIVTLVDMVMNAWLHDLYKVLGLFIPLIVTNCAILGRAESYASKNPVPAAAWDGLFMGMGFTAILVGLGAVREVLSAGTLFANASLLLGDAFQALETTLIPQFKGFLVMALPPGGFLAVGFIVAGKRLVDRQLEAAKAKAEAARAHEA